MTEGNIALLWVIGGILLFSVVCTGTWVYIEHLRDKLSRLQRDMDNLSSDRNYWRSQYERAADISDVTGTSLDHMLASYSRTTIELEQVRQELAQLKPPPPDPDGKHVEQATANRKILRVTENLHVSSKEADSEPTSSTG